MKRLLLSAAIVAMAGPAWGQEADTFETAIYTDCNPFLSTAKLKQCRLQGQQDNLVISIGQAIGESDIRSLTVPASILTSRDIRNRNQGVVADLLRTIPGLAVSQNGGAGSLTQIRLRGSEANHIVVIIDGVEVANPSDGAFDFGGLRTEDVIKIEVLRGEQSALYGSDAIGGVINIITRAGSTSESWSASVEGGSRDTLDGQVSAVIPLGGAALSVNGSAFTTQGFDISGLGGEKDGSKSQSLNVGLNSVELGAVKLSGKYGFSLRETNFDTPNNDGFLNNSNDATEVQTETARIDARFRWASFDHKISAHMVETESDTEGGFEFQSIGTHQVGNWAVKRDIGDNHTFTALAEVEHSDYELQSLFSDADVNPDFWNYGLAGDYRFSKNDITLTASARHDVNDIFDKATTWRLGAGYDFNWNGRLRGSVGTGVKNPTLIELFGFFPASRFEGNPDLQPEESLGVSIGYEQSISDINLSIDIFRSNLENEIIGSNNSVINLDTNSLREGVELAVDWSPNDKISIQGSASFLNSEQDDIEEIRRPKVLASVSASWQPSDDLTLTVSADHTGSQLDDRFIFNPVTFESSSERIKLNDYTRVGVNIRYALSDIIALTLRGSNLLDEEYQELVGYASPGRGIFAGLELDF